MKIQTKKWTVKKFEDHSADVELTPMWQRGQAWNRPRKVLLIDSILRGMDIPKIYLLDRGGNPKRYDVVDGQQRLRALSEFRDGAFPLTHTHPLRSIDGEEIVNKYYDDLSSSLKQHFENFEIVVALVSEAETHDITLLFARLQLAAPLNSAELRNAILSPIRHEVDATALTHEFFGDSKISQKRMKHQDYAAHAYGLAIHGTARDLKAPELREMYEVSTEADTAALAQTSKETLQALDVLRQVNEIAKGRLVQKWMFCDLFLFSLKEHRKGRTIDVRLMTELYIDFDRRRLAYTGNPDDLIKGKHSKANRALYDYIQAFRLQGGTRGNLRVRENVIASALKDCSK